MRDWPAHPISATVCDTFSRVKGSERRMQVILVDSDDRRRAHVSALVECAGGSAWAYECPAQFDGRARRAALYLVADEPGALASMTILVSRFDRPAYLIAYREEPEIGAIVRALRDGASDYLTWPFGAQTIRRRLQTARLREESLTAASGPQPGSGNPAEPPIVARLRDLLRETGRTLRANEKARRSLWLGRGTPS